MMDTDSRRRLVLNTCILLVLLWCRLGFSTTTSLLLTLPFLGVAFLDKTTVLFRTLMDKSPFVRRWFWGRWYDFCSASNKTSHVRFMNYGYDSPDYANFALDSSDEVHRYSIQLYHYVATASDRRIEDSDVLDVGCGRGGGTNFIFNRLKPKSIVGLDFSKENVAKASETFKNSRMRFEVGDAENMQNIADSSVDLVVNVESSHCYGDFRKFLSEVKRVLRPNGFLLFADLRGEDKLQGFFEAVDECGLIKVKHTDITGNVLRALEIESPRKEKFLESQVPRLLRFIVREFMAIEGSVIQKSFLKRKLQYHHLVLQKRVEAPSAPARVQDADVPAARTPSPQPQPTTTSTSSASPTQEDEAEKPSAFLSSGATTD